MMDFDTDSLNKMAEEISGFTDDLSEAIAVDSCVRKRYKHVLICGMGASAIGGAIFADSMYYSSDDPSMFQILLSNPLFPPWIWSGPLFRESS